ncbi:MAG: IclR family transcriptional regulator [Candidatus Velthaea sp.]
MSADRRGRVQSVEVGVGLLRALIEAGEPQALGILARAAGMPAPKAHRYLASYIESGLVTQSERSGAYDLGPLAVRMGLAAIDRHHALAGAIERLEEFRDRVNQTAHLTVWTQGGPVVARMALSRQPVTLAVRPGTTFPLLTTASGRIFLAFGDARETEPLVCAELSRAESLAAPGVPRTRADVEALIAEVRSRRLAHVSQSFLIGVEAISGPIFGPDGRLVAALTAIGPPGGIDTSWGGPVAHAILDLGS